jgi:hypothetical protein
MLLNVIDEGKYPLYRKAMRPVFEAAVGVLDREFSIGANVSGNLELGPINRMSVKLCLKYPSDLKIRIQWELKAF